MMSRREAQARDARAAGCTYTDLPLVRSLERSVAWAVRLKFSRETFLRVAALLYDRASPAAQPTDAVQAQAGDTGGDHA